VTQIYKKQLIKLNMFAMAVSEDHKDNMMWIGGYPTDYLQKNYPAKFEGISS